MGVRVRGRVRPRVRGRGRVRVSLTTSEVCGSYVEAPPTKDTSSSSEAASLPASLPAGGASVSRLRHARSCSRAWLG